MLKNSTNQNIKTLFFFSAKKVKRDFLYQSKEILQKKNIKLSKPSINIEKNIRKIRLLDNIGWYFRKRVYFWAIERIR
jgi:hypothetical protein